MRRRFVAQDTSYAAIVSETVFQAQVIEAAKLLRWDVYHTHDSRRSAWGFPDLVLIQPPFLIYAELKKSGGQPTPEQCQWLEDLHNCGEETYLWRPDDWPEIEAVLKRPREGRAR